MPSTEINQAYSELSPFIDGYFPTELKLQIERVNTHYPSLIIIDGISGSGKTTFSVLALELGQRINGNNEPINYNIQYAMGGDQFQKKLPLCIEAKKRFIIYDESGDYNKKQWQVKLNKTIDRIFDVYRTFGIIPILILPVFIMLSSELFLKGIPRLLIHCGKRGKKQGSYSIYGLRRMLMLKAKMEDKRLIIKSDAYTRILPNSKGHFRNLPPARAVELDGICSRGKMNIMTRTLNEYDGLITVNQMSESLGLSIDRTRKILSSKNIEPKKKDGKINLYDKNVLIFLQNR
jgi:hypothetical protein